MPLIPLSSSQEEVYRVKRVVDGDTLLLTNGERVRLIGVDTPEVHESKKLYRDAERTGRDVKTIITLGKKASAFTKSLVDKKGIRLEYDQANAYIRHRDRYGRILAYVYLEDGTFVNAEIIRQGYGFAYTRFPFKYMEEFRRYEREARENKRGLWSSKQEGLMINTPTWFLIAQLAASIAIVATFFVLLRQLSATRKQLGLSEETSRQLSRNHLLNTLAGLMDRFATDRGIRTKLYTGESSREENTRLCNLYDEIGHIAYRLTDEDREIVLEQWAEIFIRDWILLREFVMEKRPYSIGRDYAYFERLASKSLRFHDKYLRHLEINIYKPGEKDFSILKKDIVESHRHLFNEPDRIRKELTGEKQNE